MTTASAPPPAASGGGRTVFPRGDGFPAIARRVETTCPYCGVGCGIVLNLDDGGRIIQVDDVPSNPSSQGRLCVKGRFGLGFVHSPERLTTPLIRRRPGGPLEPASWDEALDLVAGQFALHRGSFGAVATAKSGNEDCYLVQKFARAVMGTNSVDHCARLCHAPSVVALMEQLGSGATTNSYVDYEQAGCIMVAGSDTDVNHPVIAARVRQGVANGAALIVVNPKRIRLCDIADVWLRPRPGTDVALFNGLAWIALDEGLWDPEFVGARTENFDRWRAYLAPYTPANVARITRVSEDDLRRAARLYARPAHGNSCLLWGMGITQHSRGTANVYSMVNLALLTGQIGKPGSGLSPLRGQNNVQGAGDAGALPNFLPGYHQTADPAARQKFGAAWGVELPEAPGLTLTEMMEAAGRGELTALYLCGENPVLTEPNAEHTRQGLSKLEFLVVQNIFPNETMDYAHVVLPAASFAERDGTFSNSERRVQLIRTAMAPPGQARPDWQITCDIARRTAARLGLPAGGFDFPGAASVFDEMAALVPFLAGISHQRLEAGGIQWPCPAPNHPGTPLLFGQSFPRGRGRFVPVDLGLPAAELPDDEYPLSLNTGRVLQHWHGGDLTRRSPELLALHPDLEILVHPDDAGALGIADGALARATSRRGELIGVARLTEDVRQGEIFIPFVRLGDGWANMLTNNVYDPLAKIPEYKVCAVRLAPV